MRKTPALFMGAMIVISAVVMVSSTIVVLAAEKSGSAWEAPMRAARRKNPVPPDSRSIAAGKSIYVGLCLDCHGEAGKGDGASAKDLSARPRDLSDPALSSESDGALFWKISTGRKSMPAIDDGIAERDRWNLVNYIRTLTPKDAGSTTRPAPSNSQQ